MCHIQPLTGGYSEKERAEAYSQQRALMAKTAKALMEDISGKQASFTSATHIEHVRPMFKVCFDWSMLCTSFSEIVRLDGRRFCQRLVRHCGTMMMMRLCCCVWMGSGCP